MKKEAKLSASGEKIKDYDFSAFPDRPSPPRSKSPRRTPKKEKAEPTKVEYKSSSPRTPHSSVVKTRSSRSGAKAAKTKHESAESLFAYVNDKLSGNLGGGDDSDTDTDAKLGAQLATPYKYNTGKRATGTPASSQKNPPKKPVPKDPVEEDDDDRVRKFLSASHILKQDFPEEAPSESYSGSAEYGYDFDLDSTAETEVDGRSGTLRVTRVQRDLGISDAESDISTYTDVSGKKTYRPDAPSEPEMPLHESTRQPEEDLSFLDKSDFLEPSVRRAKPAAAPVVAAPPRRARKGRVSVAKRVSPREQAAAVPAKAEEDEAVHSFLDVDPNDSFVNWCVLLGLYVCYSFFFRIRVRVSGWDPLEDLSLAVFCHELFFFF